MLLLDIYSFSYLDWWTMKKIFRFLSITVLLSLTLTGCFSKTTSNNDQIATGVAKTVAAQNKVIPVTGGDVNTQPTAAPTAIPPTAVPKVKPTADYRQAALSQFLGTWKVVRINKSSRGVPWQEIGNQLTFQQDGVMKTEAADGTIGEVKYRLDIKKVIFTLDDGNKDEWNFAFTSGDKTLALTRQGGKERIDLARVP